MACIFVRNNNNMTDILSPEQRKRCMTAVKSANTRPELIVRRFLFAKGLRYRINNRKLPGSPDIVLRKYRTVIFVDGCFWHGHEGCKLFKLPLSNRQYWEHKIRLNYAHDYRANVELKLLGWHVIRVWECELRNKSRQAETLENIYNTIIHPRQQAYADLTSDVSEAADNQEPYKPINRDCKSGEENRPSWPNKR